MLVLGRLVDDGPLDLELSLAGAGSVLIGTTLAVIAVAIFVGWIFGSAAWGFLVGAILGIPAGVYMTYQRYGHAI